MSWTEIPKLAAADFDNIMAYTTEAPPSGVGVNEAYELAIEILFGPAAVDEYRTSGGLKNRYPGEVVYQLAPDALPNEVNVLTDRLTELRLGVLLDQIGKDWPRLSDGFLQAWEQVSKSEATTAIISAGHEPFIRRTLDVWGAKHPNILVDDEEIRLSDPGTPVTEKVKPGPFPIRLTLQRWQEIMGGPIDDTTLRQIARGAVYIGDSAEKDGGLAANYDIPFVLLTPETAPRAWERYTALLGLGTMAVKTGSKV